MPPLTIHVQPFFRPTTELDREGRGVIFLSVKREGGEMEVRCRLSGGEGHLVFTATGGGRRKADIWGKGKRGEGAVE